MHFLNAGIKKRFGDKFTAACSVRNLIDRPQHVGARGEGFDDPHIYRNSA